MFLLICLLLLIFGVVLLLKVPSISHRYFARLMTGFMTNYNKMTADLKGKLFETLKEKKDKVRILEIGIGAGSNLKHYPDNTQLVAVEPNNFFEPYLKKELEKYPHVTLEKFVVTCGEDMAVIDDDSFDYVVTTIVLCSVKDVEQVLKEILRILRPGGKHYYLEHILDTEGTTLNKVQRALTQSGVWPLFLDGCQLDRRIDEQVLQAGYSSVDQKKIFLTNVNGLIAQCIRPHVVGVATK